VRNSLYKKSFLQNLDVEVYPNTGVIYMSLFLKRLFIILTEGL